MGFTRNIQFNTRCQNKTKGNRNNMSYTNKIIKKSATPKQVVGNTKKSRMGSSQNYSERINEHGVTILSCVTDKKFIKHKLKGKLESFTAISKKLVNKFCIKIRDEYVYLSWGALYRALDDGVKAGLLDMFVLQGKAGSGRGHIGNSQKMCNIDEAYAWLKVSTNWHLSKDIQKPIGPCRKVGPRGQKRTRKEPKRKINAQGRRLRLKWYNKVGKFLYNLGGNTLKTNKPG